MLSIPSRPVALDPQSEVLELRDIGARDLAPTIPADVERFGDDEPDPPTAGALQPDFADYVEQVKHWSDNALISGITCAEEGGHAFGTPSQREAWIAAAADELADRLERMARRAA